MNLNGFACWEIFMMIHMKIEIENELLLLSGIEEPLNYKQACGEKL